MATYLDLIDEDRAGGGQHAAERSRREPPHARPGTPHKRAIDRLLAKHYERCKRSESARRRFKGARLKNYCAAVAWTIVKRTSKANRSSSTVTGRETKTMAKRKMPPRYKSGPKKGQFKPRGHHGHEAGETRRKGKRGGKKGHHGHRGHGHEARRSTSRRSKEAPRRSSSRRSTPRRSTTAGSHIVLVANELAGRRRRSGMREPPRATVPRWLVFGGGMGLGMVAADIGHHWAVQTDPQAQNAPKLPNNVDAQTNNEFAADARPNFASIGVQFFIAFLGFLGGGLAARKNMSTLAMGLFGFGFGAVANLVRVLVTSYIVAPMFKGGKHEYLYQHEIEAANTLYPANDQSTTGRPNRLGAPPPREAPQLAQPAARIPIARVPESLASRLGAPPGNAKTPAAAALGSQEGGNGGGGFTYGGSGNDLPPPKREPLPPVKTGDCCDSCRKGLACACSGSSTQGAPPEKAASSPDPVMLALLGGGGRRRAA